MITRHRLVHLSGIGASLLLAGASAGCSHSDSSSSASNDTSKAEKPATPIPPDCPLAKIPHDMTQREVEAILGPPTGTNTYLGGKAFNPFNFGGDSGAMLEAHYAGLGRVVYNIQRYTGERKVDTVSYDPSDPGHN